MHNNCMNIREGAGAGSALKNPWQVAAMLRIDYSLCCDVVSVMMGVTFQGGRECKSNCLLCPGWC